MFKKPRLKNLLIAIIVVIAITSGVIIIRAATQSVTDDYTDDTMIADTWRTATSSGEIAIKVRECDDTDWFCQASTTCANYLGDGDYILVSRTNISGIKQWKTSGTSCDQPQCGEDGGQSDDNIVADNTVTFGSTYPAREECKAIGGRLPTRDELSCIYANRVTFGDNFGSQVYWSSTESSAGNAWARNFSSGSESSYLKSTFTCYVHCVRGW